MKMIEMSVREQNQVNRWQMTDLDSRPFDALEQEQPVGEIGIDQNVQITELNQKRGVTDPGDRHLAVVQFGEIRFFVLSFAPGEQRFPNHFVEESARIKSLGGR